jgi:hypothetical protein
MIPVAGNSRISLEPAGKMQEKHRVWQENIENRWNMKVVFRPENFRIFPMICGRLLPKRTGSWPEVTGKNSEIFRSEYCIHVPAIFGVFLPEPARNS